MSGAPAARVWLVADFGSAPAPTGQPTVRDDLMCIWRPGPGGRYVTGDGRHYATWDELRARHDLVEVTEAQLAEVILEDTQ